jgi:hypothetical protein
MSRRKGANVTVTNETDRKPGKWGVVFLDIPLSTDDVETLRGISFDPIGVCDWVTAVCGLGHKVSISEDADNACWIVSITGGKACSIAANAGVCVVSRGSCFEHAVLAAMYKWEVYCLEGRFPLAPTNNLVDFA